MIALFLCLVCASANAQPPAGTFKSRVYGNKTTYSDRYGRSLGSSKNYGRSTTYLDRNGKVLSREFKRNNGSTFLPSR